MCLAEFEMFLAIQAGREVRVIVDARKADDNEAFSIARSIARKVETEMTFPGEIKVTGLREVRAEAIARQTISGIHRCRSKPLTSNADRH